MLSQTRIHLISTWWLFGILILSGCQTNDSETKERESTIKETPLFKLHRHTSTGIDFVNKITDRPMMNVVMYEYYHNGAGVGVGDFNNDGLQDLYFVGNFGKNHLYLNKGGLKFEDITDSANAEGGFGWSTGVCIVDINNDGWLDIYLSKSGDLEEGQRRNELLINNGDLKFENMAADYGLDDPGYSMQASFFDYDLDGDLDAYVMNHPVNPNQKLDFQSLTKIRNEFASDNLYENRGGKYYEVSDQAGLNNNSIGFGLGLAVFDMNGDRYPEIYISNDYLERDYLYRNNGDGTFTDILTEATGHTSNFSMGNDAADINNDGLIDIYVADMAAEDNYRSKTNMSGMNPERFWRAVDAGFHYQYMINTLQLNYGNGTFGEISQLSGTDKTDWSWAPLLADFNNDGYKDLLVTNGLRKEMRNNDFVKKKFELLQKMDGKTQEEQLNILKEILDLMPSQKIPNYIFQNNGDLSFSKKTDEWTFGEPSFSNGAAYADLDNDGDLDIVINNIDDPAFLYENVSSGSNFLRIRPEGPQNNVNGIGCRVEIEYNNEIQVAEMYPSRGYLSTVENFIHFGLGQQSEIQELRVIWHDGKMQKILNPDINRTIVLKYQEAESSDYHYDKAVFRMKDFSHDLLPGVVHIEQEFDDYEKQILLPHKMSELGPALAVGDVNNDGLEDFYLGGAKGASGRLFIQENNRFKEASPGSFKNDDINEDIDALFFDFDNDDDLDLFVVSGSSESGVSGNAYRDRLYLNDGLGNFSLTTGIVPEYEISGGTVCANDLDGDGDTDLFIGGRQIPEFYPVPARSLILLNEGGKFEFATNLMPSYFDSLGMVTDAEFVDYNEDGLSDLLIVGEWMPVTIILQTENGFSDKIEFENSTGWWNCISKGDINADGREDFVLGNLGLNIRYHGSPEEPFKVYAKDFDENGHFDIVLSSMKGEENFPVRGRQCSSEQLPEITEKFPTYDLFAKATVEDIYSPEELNSAIHYEANNFHTSVLMNNGASEWKLIKMPNEAQISACEDAIIEDVNGDGKADIILAGNMLETEVETPRCDASSGILLLQKENGFEASLSSTDFGMSGNVRQLRKIRIGTEMYFLVARSNDKLSILKMERDIQ
jgi:hypothetical protein